MSVWDEERAEGGDDELGVFWREVLSGGSRGAETLSGYIKSALARPKVDEKDAREILLRNKINYNILAYIPVQSNGGKLTQS